jgi:hypothetical protein
MSSDTTDRGKNRTRSPSYPSFGLEEAIRKAQLLYDAEDRHPIPIDAVAEHWSHALKSSSLLQGVSALKQFGLLTDEGSGEDRRVRLSDLALDILLHDDGSEESAAAIKEAALKPKIHRELWEKYHGKLPSADSSIRHYLLRDRKEGVFNRDYVDAFISQFRSTIGFAGLHQSDTNAGSTGTREQDELDPSVDQGGSVRQQPTWAIGQTGSLSQHVSQRLMFQQSASGVVLRELPVTLPSLEIAILKLPVPMSEEDYSTLVNALGAMKKALVREQKVTDTGTADAANAPKDG